jgi:DNA-binding Xre family transcriptional regulator
VRLTRAYQTESSGAAVNIRRNRKASPEVRWRLAFNLRQLRKARGYTQVALARRSGLPHRYISSIEQELKNVSLANLEALSLGLECSVADLFMPVRSVAPEPP